MSLTLPADHLPPIGCTPCPAWELRVKTKRYKTWRTSVGYVMRAHYGELPRKTPLRVELSAAVSRQRDIDNLIKPTLDALQFCGVIQDDRWVDHIEISRITGPSQVQPGEIWIGLSVYKED